MPAVIPAIAGFAAGSFAVSAIGLAAGTFAALGVGLAVGALTGAVVGGLQAAIMGGDIGDGILYGAVGGAVGGALGGYIQPEMFSFAGKSIAPGSATFQPGTGPLAGYAAPNSVGGTGWVPGAVKDGAELLGGMSETSKLMLAQGGIQSMSGLMGGKDETYSTSKGGVTQQTTSNEKQMQMKNETDLEGARIAAETRKYEANLANQQTADALDFKRTELSEANAQRTLDRNTPYEQEALKRERQRQTATALTLSRQQKEASDDFLNG